MTPGHRNEHWSPSAGVIAAVMVVLFVVLMAVFLYIVPLTQDRLTARPSEAGAETLPHPGPAAGGLEALEGYPSPTTRPPSSIPYPTSARLLDPPEPYADEMYGFRADLPAGWRRAAVEDGTADYDAVFEADDASARLAFSVWDADGLVPFDLWLRIVATGMRPVDDRPLPNAEIDGARAAVLWRPEAAASPARYAAFLERDGRYYRIAYSATDGGDALGHFALALATLTWTGQSTVDLIPPLPTPGARYFPSDTLFDGPS